jgi:hypothetical protein
MSALTIVKSSRKITGSLVAGAVASGLFALEGPTFVNRDGGWVSLANLRRALRAALPDELAWATPHRSHLTASGAPWRP